MFMFPMMKKFKLGDERNRIKLQAKLDESLEKFIKVFFNSSYF